MANEMFLRARAWTFIGGFVLIYPLVLAICLLRSLYDQFLAQKKCKNIAGDVAVVTGAARGLGKCIAAELASKGCHVAIVDVRMAQAEETAKYIAEKYNVKTKAYEIDVTKYEELVTLNEQVTKDLGLATILVNNAGILLHANPGKPTAQEIQNMINVNYMAHFLTNQIFVENMKFANKGHIMAISSAAGLVKLVYNEPYCSTKHAVRALMRTLRFELIYEGYKNIHTTTIFPSFLQTHAIVEEVAKEAGFTQIYPLISGEEIAQRAVLAILRNETEVAMPSFFLLLNRLFEFLPIRMQNDVIVVPLLFFNNIFEKMMQKVKIKSAESQKIVL